MIVLGLDTATPATVVGACCADGRGRSRRATTRAPGARPRAREPAAAARRAGARRRPGPDWADVDRIARRRRAGRRSPACGSAIATARALAQARGLPARRASRRSRRSRAAPPATDGARASPCSTPAAARRSPPPGATAARAARARPRSRPEALAERARARCPGPWLAVGDGAVRFRAGARAGRGRGPGGRLAPSTASSAAHAVPARRGEASRPTATRSLPDYRARARRRAAAAAVTAPPAAAIDDPPPHLRRPPAGHRDRAPRVPDAVVAGDVRARAVQAVGHLPRRRRRRRARRLPDLLALRHGLARDERRGRPRPRAAHGIATALLDARCSSASTTRDAQLTLEVRPLQRAARSRSTSASASARAGVRRRYYQDNGEDAVIMWRTPATLRGTLDDVPERAHGAA